MSLVHIPWHTTHHHQHMNTCIIFVFLGFSPLVFAYVWGFDVITLEGRLDNPKLLPLIFLSYTSLSPPPPPRLSSLHWYLTPHHIHLLSPYSQPKIILLFIYWENLVPISPHNFPPSCWILYPMENLTFTSWLPSFPMFSAFYQCYYQFCVVPQISVSMSSDQK